VADREVGGPRRPSYIDIPCTVGRDTLPIVLEVPTKVCGCKDVVTRGAHLCDKAVTDPVHTGLEGVSGHREIDRGGLAGDIGLPFAVNGDRIRPVKGTATDIIRIDEVLPDDGLQASYIGDKIFREEKSIRPITAEF